MSEARSFFSELGSLTFRDSAKIATLVAQAGEDWYEADSLASSLEEQKKNYLAKLTLEYLEAGVAPSRAGAAPKAIPVSQAEMRALADPRYEEYLKNMVDARKRANLSRVRYDMGKVYIDMQRSVMATQRQEMQALNLHQ